MFSPELLSAAIQAGQKPAFMTDSIRWSTLTLTVDDLHHRVSCRLDVFKRLHQHRENWCDFDGALDDLTDGLVALTSINSTRCRSTPPNRKTSPVMRPPESQRKRPREAEATLGSFLRNVPKASEWRSRQIELGLIDVDHYECVIGAFRNISVLTERGTCYEGAHLQDHMIRVAQALPLPMRKPPANAHLQKSLERFQTLILLSYCQVLSKMHVTFHGINEVIGHIAPDEMQRRKMLKGALQVNKIINQLVDSGWTINRATELFFISALSRHQLKSIHHGNNISLIFDHLKSHDYAEHDFSDCVSPNYTIPGLVRCLIGTYTTAAYIIPTEEICNALGYSADRVSQSNQDVLPARSPMFPPCEFEVFNLSSFGKSDLSSSSVGKSRGAPSNAATCQAWIRTPSNETPPRCVGTSPNAESSISIASLPTSAPSHGQLALSFSWQSTSNTRYPERTTYPPSQSLTSTPPRMMTKGLHPLALTTINNEVLESPTGPTLLYDTTCDAYQLDQKSREVQWRSHKRSRLLLGRTTALISTTQRSAIPNAGNQRIYQADPLDIQSQTFAHTRLARSPSTPGVFLIPEHLLRSVKVYFDHACRNVSLDDHGNLLNVNGLELKNDLCVEFDSHCFTATMFAEKGLWKDFGLALGKASALVEEIIRAEHPRTLACFLEVFIHLLQVRLPEAVNILRGYVKQMSAKVTPEGKPWRQICRFLGELDSESLGDAMTHLWECTIDAVQKHFGRSTRFAVSVRLDYIKRVYGFANYLEEERLLRQVLAEFHDPPELPTPRVMLNLAHNMNKQGRHGEAEEMAYKIIDLLETHEMYAKRISETIECRKIISRGHLFRGKTQAAEQTMQEAVRMIVNQWGEQHPWVLEFQNLPDHWLRNTARGELVTSLRGRDQQG